MDFHAQTVQNTLSTLSVSANIGLSETEVKTRRLNHGANTLTKSKKRKFISKVFDALKEPMLLILIFSFILAFGVALGKYFKTGDGDFGECFGILFAVVLSVSITLIMEGSSEKAFNALNKIYDNVYVKVLRDGEIKAVLQEQLVVGDIVLIETGDKIVADGRLIESESLSVDESALTGESYPVKKDASAVLQISSHLADRKNCVYSGTFVSGGNGKMAVTAVGDKTEIGSIAGELKNQTDVNSPLQQKLAKLGKRITLIGGVTAVIVFIINIIRLALTGTLTFNGVQELFVSCIILIVAAVPEGLPTIVVVSLALNMIKLAKENALIKKMIATETAGAVSVICSDKTGTITENKMRVLSVCTSEFCYSPEKLKTPVIMQNFYCNTTAEITKKDGKPYCQGSGTELALISAKSMRGDYKKYREKYPVIDRTPFSSATKMMTTTINVDGVNRTLLKGAPEVVLKQCNLTDGQLQKLLFDMGAKQKQAKRVLCFAHRDGEGSFEYDGYCVLADGIRKEVFKAVKDCKKAGIKIKILTGDNYLTAYAVAKELGVVTSESEVISSSELEKLDDKTLCKILTKISVIARSTPIIKLRVVRALKSMGEVVAVTGDGINDAPAIKHADIGIAMGKTGSEITKEAADVVLLDDSFATIVKAISFGRNVYRNLQRFILFQLSVNSAALLFITVCAAVGLNSPFNTLQLLWINVIMDGPPALTLGLEKMGDELMSLKPVARDKSIVSKKMLIRIAFNGIFMASIMLFQYVFNILGVAESEKSGTIFTLFILFQLFNAFNSRELGAESVFKSVGKNKIMLLTFGATFLIQIIMVQFCSALFGVQPLSLSSWIKVLFTAGSIIIVSEAYKLIYRAVKKQKQSSLINKNQIGA